MLESFYFRCSLITIIYIRYFVLLGQQVVEEILDSQRPACPPEYFNIEIPKWHSFTIKPGHTSLPVLRTRYDQRTGLNPNNPRQQVNSVLKFSNYLINC